MARNILYHSLSLCYSYPDGDIYSWMHEGKWVEELKGAIHQLTDEAFASYLSPFPEILKEGKVSFFEMKREYSRLFGDGVSHVMAPPYGSSYLSGKTTSEVIQFYHANGFALKEDPKEPADHIVHEFEFMALLAYQESQAAGSDRIRLEEEQMKFFSRFILPWVPGFCDRVETHTWSPFYCCLGILTREFINLEKNYLGIPEEVDCSL